MDDLMEFKAWPKIPRLSRPIVVTEKIDGTNAAIVVRPLGDGLAAAQPHETVVLFEYDGETRGDVAVYAQSRKRIISPEDDNFGFAAWVHDNAEVLARGFGLGRHFGEWWGYGIQRGYGVNRRYFSPFNVSRWTRASIAEAGLPETVVEVPILGQWGAFDTNMVQACLDDLIAYGSHLRPVALMTPAEGVMVYHSASGQMFKRLIERDDRPKGVAAEQFATAG